MLVDVIDLDPVPAPTRVGAADPGVIRVGRTTGRLDAGKRLVARTLALTLGPVDDGPEVVGVGDVDRALADLQENVACAPHAALACTQVLRLGDQLDPIDGIVAESLAYSTLLGGEEFRAWRASVPVRDRTPSIGAVRVRREGDVLRITLNRPERRNALDAAARGALSDALDVAIADPTVRVELRGEGQAFCGGGDLDEFGTVSDLALAHVLRVGRGPASRMFVAGPRTTAILHGGVVGAGVELAAFAGRLVAESDTTLRLPEVSMGLIPGAGGTVSVTRRIGRWRAAWWMLSGALMDLDRAKAWGLVDHVR